MSNIHNLLDDEDLHVSKGFAGAAINDHLIKDETGAHAWEQRIVLPQAIKLTPGSSAPPTEVSGDIYLLDGTSSIHANWDGADSNDWVRYDGTAWNSIPPERGYQCFNKFSGEYVLFDGTQWSAFGSGVSEWSELTGSPTDNTDLTNLFKLGNYCVVDKTNGNDGTGVRGSTIYKFQEILAAQTAASAGDTILILSSPTAYTSVGLGKDGITYLYLGECEHSVSTDVIYQTSTGETFSVLGNCVFYNGDSAILRSLSSSSNNIVFKCRSITRAAGGASAIVCNEGTVNVEASEFVSSDTNCATCQNGTLTIKAPKFIGGGSTFAVSGTGAIHSHGEINVSSSDATLRSAILNISIGKIFHRGNITYSNVNSTSGIIDLRTGADGYVRIEGNIYATSFNSTYGVINISQNGGIIDLFGKIIGTKTIKITGSSTQYNEVFIPDQNGHNGETLYTDGTSVYWDTAGTSGGSGIDGTGVANMLPYWVDADTLGNLDTATYPNLTEMSYVKGLTSALQTQLDAKAALAGVIYQRRRAGRYYHAGIINNPQSYTTGTYAHDFLRAYPVYFPRAVTIDKLATYVNTGVASSNIRIGIYTDNGSFYPDTLIIDSGDVSTASGGQKEATVTQALSPGLYWFAHVFSSSSISFYAMTTSAFNDQFGLDNSATSAQHWRVAHTFGALPSTFTGGGITRNEAMAFLQFVIS